MSFVDRIREANRHDLAGFLPFFVGDARIGWVRGAFAARLSRWPGVFAVDPARVALAAELGDPRTDPDRRTAAVNAALLALRDEGLFPNWRDEPFAIAPRFGAPPLLLLERAALPTFGVTGHGVHMNGFVRDGARTLMWIGVRAADRATAPGRLDQLVAGGQPAGIGLRENVAKECEEEAGIGAELLRPLRQVSTVSYTYETEEGLRPDKLFCFDLELPGDFQPVNRDGEVARFHLWPMEQVLEIVSAGAEFKFNCSLVVIDFALRHGFIDASHPEYDALRDWAGTSATRMKGYHG